jgi:hypothetical protein
VTGRAADGRLVPSYGETPMIVETVVGDVLILLVDPVSQLYAVGLVSADGQQSFAGARRPIYANDRATAAAMAKAMVVPGRRIFVGQSAANEWSEVSR